MNKVAVLIPCYNESKTIHKVVKDWISVLPNATVYVYDNNSTDGTAQIAEDAGAIVKYEYRQGKGNVIRSMFRDIEADCYIMVDGDDTYPSEVAPEMVRLVLEKGVDMVVGDRLSSTYFEENHRPFHSLGNAIVRIAINHLFKTNIQDIMTGYRAFSYLFVKSFAILSHGFEIETEMTIHAIQNNMLVENYVIDYRNRPEGSNSKLNTYTDGIKVIRTILCLYKNNRPFEFFTLISVILIVWSFALFFPVFWLYLKIGEVPNFPTLIVSGFIALAAIISFFSGLILSTIVEKERKEFELNLINIKNWKHHKNASE